MRPRPQNVGCHVVAVALLVVLVRGLTADFGGAARWTVRADVGTPVLHAPLIARPPAPMVHGSARGFHSVVHMHAPASAFPEVDASRFPRETVRDYHVVPLYGGLVAVGEYYAKVLLGGQMVHVQIDTGSATMAAPMKECKTCLAGDRRYNILKSAQSRGRKIGCEDKICTPDRCMPFTCGTCSSTNACCAKSDTKSCGFHLNYGDGSGAKGVLVKDFMTWGGVSFPTVFGGIENDSPDFERKEVDGILGMAYPSLACNPSCVVPAFDAMVKYLSMKSIFQICMNEDSGSIVLGDYDKSLGKEDPVWVPMALADPPSYYTVKFVSDLQVNGKPVGLPAFKSGIVDSGTTLIVLSSANFDLLLTHLQSNYCDVPGLCDTDTWFRPAHCTEISDQDLMKMPTLRFRLDGYDLVLGPKEYLVNYASKGPGYWCVGIMQLASLSGGIDVILGNTVMKKYVTVFDRENSRVGFSVSRGTCKTAAASESSGSAPTSQPANSNSSALVPGPEGQGSGAAHTNSTESKPGTGTGQSGAGPTKSNGNPDKDVFATSAECASARDCGACANVPSKKCVWDIPSQLCKFGEPVRFICVADFLEDKVAYVIGIAISLVILIIGLIVLVVCAHRKRQNAIAEAAVDPDEAAESRVPLAPEQRQGLKGSAENSVDDF